MHTHTAERGRGTKALSQTLKLYHQYDSRWRFVYRAFQITHLTWLITLPSGVSSPSSGFIIHFASFAIYSLLVFLSLET